MERTILYGAGGCFIGTMFSLLLNQYNPNPFLLFLLPMWGMIFAIAIARVVNLYKVPEEGKKFKK